MKFATPFTLVALLAVSLGSASAAECTAEQLVTNAEAQLSVSSATGCKKINFATSSQAEVCADAKCLDVITKAAKNFESCTLAGVNVKDTLEGAIASCKSSNSTATTTSAPAAGSATPAPSSSATSATAVSTITVAASSIVIVYAMRM